MKDALAKGLVDWPEEETAAVGVRGPVSLDDVLFVGSKANKIAPLQAVRADRVAGPDHIRLAARNARRAFAEKRNQADRLEVEFTRYLAGERQIRVAIQKMGVEDKGGDVILVAFGPKRHDALEFYVHAAGATLAHDLLEEDPARLAKAARAFGIVLTEGSHAPAPQDLVLEAVATVDLLK